jgi:hypothetical protein
VRALRRSPFSAIETSDWEDVNIVLDAKHGKELLSLLDAFLQARLRLDMRDGANRF